MKIQNRPKSLAEVTARSVSKESFGRELADFEHELQRCSSRKGLSAAIEDKPELLRGTFPTGAIADAWLAAYAEHLAHQFALAYPEWIFGASRFLGEPYIHDTHSRRLKVWHTLKAPPAFSRRNLFVDIHLPLIRLRRGRPRKSAAHKREMNRLRVARHRAKVPRIENAESF